MGLFSKPLTLPDAAQALPGREMSMPVAPAHFVLGTPMVGPFPSSLETIQFGMGCFWGAERRFWQIDGVFSTAAGYAGGITKTPVTRKCVVAVPVILKLSWSSTIQLRFHWIRY